MDVAPVSGGTLAQIAKGSFTTTKNEKYEEEELVSCHSSLTFLQQPSCSSFLRGQSFVNALKQSRQSLTERVLSSSRLPAQSAQSSNQPVCARRAAPSADTLFGATAIHNASRRDWPGRSRAAEIPNGVFRSPSRESNSLEGARLLRGLDLDSL
jgi:hypothetical protein